LENFLSGIILRTEGVTTIRTTLVGVDNTPPFGQE